MRYLVAGLVALLLGGLLLSNASSGEESSVPFEPFALPAGWEIAGVVRVDDAQLKGFSQRLGGTLESLTNQVVSVGGYRVRVNCLVAATDADAGRVERTMRNLRGRNFTGRDGRRVYEVTGDNVLVARRVFAALGMGTDATTTWKAVFQIALVDDLDYTAGNRVFNHFLALEKDPDDAAAKAGIRAETEGWTFGTTLRLRSPSSAVEWSFEPVPVETTKGDLQTTYRFEDPPRREGVPYVEVTGHITTTARFEPSKAPRPSRATGAATRFWPADAEPVAEAASAAVGEATGDAETLRALLRHVSGAIRYGGAMGSRDGVLEVLGRGYGRCWDKSDVLVTLCRAAKIPARQVGGWVPVIGAGHIWTEVYVDGGWLPVDATTTWLGTSDDYIPFFVTEEGPMPIVYLGMPRIRRAEKAGKPGAPAVR